MLQRKGRDEVQMEAIQVAALMVRIIEEGDNWTNGHRGTP